MGSFYLCKVSYVRCMENGCLKKVHEYYLIESVSFTEAEKRIVEEIQSYISGEFTIQQISWSHYSEMFLNGKGEKFYKVKVNFITLDEKSGAEKKTSALMLVEAGTTDDAIESLKKNMEGTMSDYIISSVSETAIIDVIPYKKGN